MSFTFLSRRTLSRHFSTAEASHVYMGRRYEEASQQMLTRFGIQTHLVGGKSDGGIDLLGSWHLSDTKRPTIIAQCKNITKACPPSYVREMEGVASQYNGDGAVALMIASREGSEATMARIRSSKVPFMYFYFDGLNVRRVFVNNAIYAALPHLVIGSRHVGQFIEPVFYYTEESSTTTSN